MPYVGLNWANRTSQKFGVFGRKLVIDIKSNETIMFKVNGCTHRATETLQWLSTSTY